MENLSLINEISKVAYDFVVDFDANKYEDGRYDLSDGVYVNIQSYETKDRVNCLFEAHKKYIDIQYMIKGEELITISSVDELEESEPYDDEKDITFYSNCLRGKDYLIENGTFLIIKPYEAHMPCVAVNGNKNVRKMVIKIPV